MNTAHIPSVPLAFFRQPPAPAAPAAVAKPGSATHQSHPTSSRVRKPFTRRRGDRSQTLRRGFQAAFILLNVWLGAQFYLFVRYYETGGATMRAPRPAGIEGWLPIAGLMNLKFLADTGTMPAAHPAAMVLLASFLTMTVVFRKAFCSWLCPVGTISEWLWQGGREIFKRNFAAPRWLDIPLRSLKYLLLFFFAWAIWHMPAAAIAEFMQSPYGIIADVKMLNFFRHLGQTGAIVIAVLIVSSVFVKNVWCRYLCPYGALLGIVSMFSLTRIRRNPDACIDCAKCAKACPSLLPVDKLLSVQSAECTGCLECVAICPAKGALDLSAGRRFPIPARAVAFGIAALFFGFVAAAMLTGHWQTLLPDAVYFEMIPNASSFGHPGGY